jgi:predicted ATP-grasp superfamily ATP-dependent carboligase
VRAAAFSARRAGFAPLAADLFADQDLAACCPTKKVDDYPDGLASIAAAMPPAAWMYTGALENQPGLVDRIASARTLYGNPGRVLREARDPRNLAAALKADGLPFLEVRLAECELDQGRWLCKPWRSCGGGGIRLVGQRPPAEVEPGAAGPASGALFSNEQETTPRRYFQRFVAGSPCSAVYVAAAGRASLIGATEQLIGEAWTGAAPFSYAGSVGPLSMDRQQREQFQRIGDCLAGRFGLQGLFGIDIVSNRQGMWPVEVNPRYTASVEVLERSLGVCAVRDHVAACREGRLPVSRPVPDDAPCCGKAVVYARSSIRVDSGFSRLIGLEKDDGAWPGLADIPQPGTTLNSGGPLATVFAAGRTAAAVRGLLRQRVERLQQQLGC